MPKRKSDTDIALPAKVSRINEVISRGNNALMMLNEIGLKRVKWIIEQIPDSFPQKFKASCQLTENFVSEDAEVIPAGMTFYAEGPNKASCKHKIAELIIKRISGKQFSSENFPKISEDRVIMCNEIPNCDEEVVKILNEKAKDVQYKFVATENGFMCFISLGGFVFKAVDANKKVAKRLVAYQALRRCFKMVFSDKKAQRSSAERSMNENGDVEKLPPGRQKKFTNQIQSMIKNSYEKVISSVDMQYAKRKVVAGIVISRHMKSVFPQYYRDYSGINVSSIDPIQFTARTGWSVNPDDPGEILKVIIITSGTKCISGNDLNANGYVVNDCHAEIVAKRALQLFIYKAISRYQNGFCYRNGDELYGCDIVETIDANNSLVYKLKHDVNFHLYISSPPCGDSRIFMSQSPASSFVEDQDDEYEEDSHPNRKNRGLLRTKIECGEGTIPIKSKTILTLDGLVGGERLRTMSCSDKVCSWIVLGAQGALLSNLLQKPIFFDSIIIGTLFNYEHLHRALIERSQLVLSQPEWINAGNVDNGISDDEDEQNVLTIDVDQSSTVTAIKYPRLLSVSEPDEQCASKATNYSVNWLLGSDSFEIISTSKGLTVDNSPSRLCKRYLFLEFLSVFKWLPHVPTVERCYAYCEMKSLYDHPDTAIGSVNYQKRRMALFSFLENQGFGHWISKPIELDWFTMKDVNR